MEQPPTGSIPTGDENMEAEEATTDSDVEKKNRR